MALINRTEQWACGLLMGAGVLQLLSAPGVLAFQAILWLRDGFWKPIYCRGLWNALGGVEPAFAWKGIQQIATGALDQPVSLGLLISGMATVCLASIWGREEAPKAPD